MSGFTGIELRLVDRLGTPSVQGGFVGMELQLVDAPSTPLLVGGLTGMSIGITVRTLTVWVYKLLAGAYVPLASYPITLTLVDTHSSRSGATDATGKAYFEFSDVAISVELDPASIPPGHSAVLSYPMRANSQNEVVVTFIPDVPARFYPFAQVL